MKIVTVNVPESYIDAIEKLVGEEGLYPSRSELIRCAVREFLLRELKIAINISKPIEKKNIENLNTDGYVNVPVENKNEKNEPVRAFKTYKIIRRLDYNDEDSKHEEYNKDFVQKPKPKGKKLGNIFFDRTFDETGNLISVPKKDNLNLI